MATIDELYPSNYLRAADLKGREVVATIERIEIEEFEDSGRKRRKPVAHFKGAEKGLILNKTNSLTLATLCGSQDTGGWVGHRVKLYPTMVSFQSRIVEAIRIGPGANGQQPAAAPVVPPAEPADADDWATLDDAIPF